MTVAGYIHGYAAVFGNVDRQDEVTDPGAFGPWLAAHPGKALPVLWMHADRMLPVGLATTIKEDARGLYFRATILGTAFGRDLFTAVDAGAIAEASFAYRIVDAYEKDGRIHLSQLDPIEISVVTTGFAANPDTHIEVTQLPEPAKAAHLFADRLRRFVARIEKR
jgi:HK97 family phage prohead protease